jgi:hypothetical protein
MTDTARWIWLPAGPAKRRLSRLHARCACTRPCRQRDSLGRLAAEPLRPAQAGAAAADSGLMQSLISWIAYGLGTLFFGACVVAWWEHLGRDVRRSEEPDWDAPPRPAVSVDVELDALQPPSAAPSPADSPASGDVRERRQALGGAITRMASGDRRQGFGDTVPMILAGAAHTATQDAAPGASDPAAPAERRQRDRATASD